MDGRPRGRSIVIVGPDGAGKSALAEAVTAQLGGDGQVMRAHLRAPVLPRRTRGDDPTRQPHAQEPYGHYVSIAKVAWLFADMQAMWRVIVPLALRRGRHVVVERGWWDLAVDPRHYRLANPDPVIRLAGALPEPDLEVVLTGPARVLVERTPELPIEEIDRQSRAWRELRPTGPGVLHLDADRPIPELVDAVLEHPSVRGPSDGVLAAVRHDRKRVDRWVHLPLGGEPMWHVPRSPRATAAAGLRIHRPLTHRSAIGWWIARAFASMGGFRLLPGHPAPEAIGTIWEVAPPDSAFAVATGGRPGRATILVLDRDGRALALAKTATDDEGRATLAREASVGSMLAAALPRPLSSPRLLAQGRDFLLFEFVIPSPRRAAWEMSDDVALAVGRFYRAGRRPGLDAGFTHGDLVPWNVLETINGWSIAGWAEARPDGPPFYDVLHYLIESHVVLGRPTYDDLLDGLHGRGRVGRMIAAYAEGAGLEAGDVLRHLPAYLNSSERKLPPGPDRVRGEVVRAGLRVSACRLPS